MQMWYRAGAAVVQQWYSGGAAVVQQWCSSGAAVVKRNRAGAEVRGAEVQRRYRGAEEVQRWCRGEEVQRRCRAAEEVQWWCRGAEVVKRCTMCRGSPEVVQTRWCRSGAEEEVVQTRCKGCRCAGVEVQK